MSTASNTIGGSVAGAGNLLSGNDRVGLVLEVGANANVVQGNFIGTNAAGSAAVPDGLGGIEDNGGASNIIGGTTGVIETLGIAAFAGNLISGNTGDGVEITTATATGNVVEGDYIGTNAAGTAALANVGNGVAIDSGASSNTIGGLTTTPGTGAGNVISGNIYDGVDIYASAATGNLVVGNLIGTNAAGTAALGNGSDGVLIERGSVEHDRRDHGLGPEYHLGQRPPRYRDQRRGATGNLVEGNYVGTDITGTTALGNVGTGVYVSTASNTIGGSVAGAGNVLSGNDRSGLALEVGANANVVEGNFIGTNAAGTAALANVLGGILVNGGASNTIGGSTGAIGTLGIAAFAGNLISGNTGDGVEITTATATGNVVEGDYIGTDVTGTVAIANGTNGVQIDTSASGNTIGGTTAGARNVISGNAYAGVEINAANDNLVEGNFIGTDTTGTVSIANNTETSALSYIYGDVCARLRFFRKHDRRPDRDARQRRGQPDLGQYERGREVLERGTRATSSPATWSVPM